MKDVVVNKEPQMLLISLIIILLPLQNLHGLENTTLQRVVLFRLDSLTAKKIKTENLETNTPPTKLMLLNDVTWTCDCCSADKSSLTNEKLYFWETFTKKCFWIKCLKQYFYYQKILYKNIEALKLFTMTLTITVTIMAIMSFNIKQNNSRAISDCPNIILFYVLHH